MLLKNSTLVVKAMFLCASGGGRVVASSNLVTPTDEKILDIRLNIKDFSFEPMASEAVIAPSPVRQKPTAETTKWGSVRKRCPELPSVCTKRETIPYLRIL